MSLTRATRAAPLRADAVALFQEMARITRLPDLQRQVEAMAVLADAMWQSQERFRIVSALPEREADQLEGF